jgi:hypothetical protein
VSFGEGTAAFLVIQIVQLGGFLFPEKSYAASPTRMLRLRLRKDVIRVGAWLVRLYKVIWRLRELSVPA